MSEMMEQWLTELLNVNDKEEAKMTEKQIKILKAAVEIFSEKGYAASSTSEIAQKAGVAEGTIFRHYKTKKDLLISIVAPTVSKLIAPFVLKDFNKVLEAPYPKYEDFLRAVIKNRMEFARNNLQILKILIQEIPFQPDLRENFKQSIGKQVLERITKVVERYQKEGTIISIPPLSVIRLSVSTIIGFFLARFILFPELDWDEELETELTIDFIMHGLSPRYE
ncbi:TetR/AcrR family transcriptional regulator [Paenibacillus sediminis]|uniref:AcrR family transcriptional regulator n=1 Tax=Paenibacillus sediminis TaxID=664909 RepID=A0ABS4H1Z5_9BACL|nr:TetR/AcrR family transcriptional regulator [Paenibacillus sediminis]MBP1936533.1 AcrR family transcriptional regulator [Paenibacillus sediminis]